MIRRPPSIFNVFLRDSMSTFRPCGGLRTHGIEAETLILLAFLALKLVRKARDYLLHLPFSAPEGLFRPKRRVLAGRRRSADLLTLDHAVLVDVLPLKRPETNLKTKRNPSKTLSFLSDTEAFGPSIHSAGPWSSPP